MKKISLLLLTTLISTTFSFGQITLDFLIFLRSKNISEFESYLSTKGWSLDNIEEATDSSTATVTLTKTESESIHYLMLFEGKRKDHSRIGLFTTDKKVYSQILSRLISLNYVAGKYKVQGSAIKKIYKNEKLAVEIEVSNQNQYPKKTATTYGILITSKEEYEKILEKHPFN